MTYFRFPGFKLFLAALIAAVAGTFALTAVAHPRGHAMAGAPFMGGRMIERMLDHVKATDAQREQIRRIADAAAADMKKQRESGAALRRQGMELFAQPTVDASAVEALRQQMLQQHDATSKRMTQAMLEISQVLTPEQRATLAERMKQRGDAMRRHHERHGDHRPRS
jgi:Spy/CpxP family protein refolding chaperone